ncbi:MAG TPA: hypothetical protein VIT90_07015 [Lysobacter sp.]
MVAGVLSRFAARANAKQGKVASQSGQAVQARFTALDAWAPIVGNGLDEDVGVFGLSLGADFGRANRISFDLDNRHSDGENWSGAQLNWRKAF